MGQPHQRRARPSGPATYDSRDTDRAKRVPQREGRAGWDPARVVPCRAEDAFFRATSSGARPEGRARRDGDRLLRQADKQKPSSCVNESRWVRWIARRDSVTPSALAQPISPPAGDVSGAHSSP